LNDKEARAVLTRADASNDKNDADFAAAPDDGDKGGHV
jgi:hypothetical protein